MINKIVICVLLLFNLTYIVFGDNQASVPNPKAKFTVADLSISEWNPPTSLSTHFGHGTWTKNAPIFNFNLNLGYLRYYMKSDLEEASDGYNEWFTYIIEIKPFDFASFLTSGSSYSIFVEKHEWLRNFTLIINNKNFSSTQFISAPLMWYFDFLYNSIPVPNIVVPQNGSAKSALSRLYPITREVGIGFSDRLHLYQTPTLALGLVMYFEFNIPVEKQVSKDPSNIQSQYLRSSDLTFGALGGLFFRYKEKGIEINTSALYQRLQGDFDVQVITVEQNTISVPFEISYADQYFGYFNYYFLHWSSRQWDEQFFSHTVRLGGEIKGFSKKVEWIGTGVDFFYQRMKQDIASESGNLDSFMIILSLNWYPLSFHSKNQKLKISLLYGFVYHDSDRYRSTGEVETDHGWNYSLMMKVSYNF